MAERYLIVAGKFNEFITKHLHEGAIASLKERGVSEKQIETIWVPGSFEIPVVAAKGARSNAFSAIIALGAVIRGETPHFDHICQSAASGLMTVSVETGVPVIFGVITTDNAEQALARCGIKGANKGREAAETAVTMVQTMLKLKEMERH